MTFPEIGIIKRCKSLGAAYVIPRNAEIDVYRDWMGAVTWTTGDDAYVAISSAADGSALLVVPKARFSVPGSTG